MPDVRPNATAHRSGAAHRPASGFELRLDRGGAHVHLAPSPPGSGLAIEALDLEVPDVRMPIDVGAGPSQFQNRLCDLCKLAVRLEPGFLAAAASRVDRAALGLDGLEVALQDGFVEVGGTLRGGPAFALRIALVQGVERGVQAVPYAARVFGPSAVPAAALAAQAARALVELGLPEDPLPALLRKLLVARGWKAPREKAVRLSALSVSPVGIKLAWDRQPAAPISPPIDPALLAALEGARAFEAAERLLADGDFAGARETLLGDPAAASHPFAAERVLSLLCLEERFHDEALDLAADWLARRPGFAPALAAEAWIRLARGEQERAAAALVGLAEDAVAGNERIAAAAAAEAALALPGASRATRQRAVDAALAVKRDHLAAIRAQHALAKEIGDKGGQLRAVRRLLAYAPGDSEKARAHAELGELLLEKDPPAARLHLDRALRLDPGDPESMATLARACLAAGEHLRAVRALDRLRELKLQAGDKAEAARLALQTGAIWESPLGHLENAWLRYREAAELGPGAAEAHRLAAACAARLGRWADAADHHAAALAMVDAGTLQGAAAAAAHHLALAEVAELHLDDPAGAAGHLEAATALVSPDAALLARLASLYRRLDRPAELAAALERLAPLGPDPVERAALLAEAGDLLRQKLGRDEAAQARYAAALGHEPACRRALAGMAAVASARGDAAAERDALQRLLAISGDKGEQATLLDRLASACERSGDLPAASRAVASARRLAPTRARLAAAVALARSAGDRHSLTGLLDEMGRLAAADGDPAGGAAAFRERCDLLEPDDLPLAMASLGEARRLLPGDTSLLRREAALAAKAGDHQLALGALKALLEGEPVDAPALELTAARTALAAGQITEACAHAQRAFVAGATGAVEVLDEALTRNGDESGRAGLLSRLGRHLEAAALHEHLGDLSAAVGALESAAAVPATAVESLRHLIRLRAQRGDAPGTALALVAAARLSGGREGAELALRAFHLAPSDEALDVAASADPSFAPARAERARRRAERDPSGALTDAEAALAGLELDPVRRPELLRLAARLALDAGDAELGRRRLAAFCQVGVPDDADLDRLADLQRAAGDDQGLVAALERRLPLAPPELALPLRLELATLLSRLGRDQEAVARWRQALSLDRQALPALNALLDAARAGALVDGERAALLTLLARHGEADAPSRAAAWDELAAQREAARDLRGAMDAVAEAARLRGEEEQILRRHADLATRLGDQAVAATAWDELAARREAARDLRGAMEAVTEAARLRGEEEQALRRHADLAARLGDTAAAAKAWDDLAARHEAARDLRGAMEAVAEAARLRGEEEQILRRHADLATRLGDTAVAAKAWDDLAARRETARDLRGAMEAVAEAARLRGEEEQVLRRHADLATRLGDQAVAATAWDELAARREAARDLRGAMEAVAEAARLRGEEDEILERHADLATRLGDQAVAATAWDELAARREAARDLRGAMEAVAEAARLRGEEEQILRRHADLATRLGDQAVAATAWDELAARREAARDLRGAMEAVAEAARLRGEEEQILRRHADLATRLGDHAVAAAAWDELAARHEAARDLRGAMEAVAEAARLRGEEGQVLRRHADLATRLGDQSVAATAWDELAARREAARDLRGAMDAVAEAARLRGEEDEILERHADLATRLGDQAVAATALLARARRGLERSEVGAPARLVEAGLAAVAAGLETDGVAALEEAIGLSPGAEPLRAARTSLLERAVRLGDRAGEARQLAALVPLLPTGERPGQLLRLSDLRTSLVDLPGALAAAEEARALAPRDLQTVHRTRLAAEAAGADRRVAELLAEEAELDPSLAGPLLLDRARRLLALGQAEAADDAFQEAQRLLDADLALATEQSRLRRTHGIGRSAADPLERCAKRTADPGAAARVFLAAAALALQEDDRATALRCARRAHSRRRDAPAEAGPLLARLLYEQGAFAEALVLHRTLLESGFAGLEDADVVALCRQLAELAAEAGERSLALQALDRLLALRPQEAEAARLRFALDPDRAHAVTALAEIAGRQASEANRGALLGEAAQAALAELRDRSLGERLFREARSQAARVAGAPLALVRRRVEVTRAADLGPEALLSALQEAAEATGDAGLTAEARTFLEEAVREERDRGMWAAAARDLAQLEALHATEGDFHGAAERARQAGELLAEAGDLPGALEALERAAEAEPEHRPTLERIAELGRALGDAGGGNLAGALERLAALAPAGAPRMAALLRKAEAEESVLHDAPRAEASLRAALVEAPGQPDAEAALQALLERTGRGSDLARRLLDQARTEADTASRTALRQRAAELLGRSGDQADLGLAADAAVAIALDAPSDLGAARAAAAALQIAGRSTEAVPHHALVARVEPGDEAAVAALLQAYAARPRERAELHLARAAATQGAIRAARLREAAQAFVEAGESSRADQAMEQAFQAWPADEAAFAGAVSAAGDDLDRLDAVLRTRAEAVPAEAAGCHRARADMLFTMGRLERAAEAFEAALATDPEDAAGLATLGACLVSLHGAEAARHTDRRLAALAEARPGRVPASLEAEARYRLGLHASPGTAAGSIRTDLERALWLAPEDPRADRAFEALAEAHLGLDDLPGALSAVRARAERAAARGDEAAELAALERGEVLLTDRPDPSADGAALLDGLLVRRTAGSFATAEVEPLARRVAEAWRALDQEARARQALTRAGLPPVEPPTHLVAAPSEPVAELEILEPFVGEPVAVEPVAVEPVAVEPVAVEPVAVEPVVVEPVAVEPVAVEPVVVEPVAELAVESPEALEPLSGAEEERPVETVLEPAAPPFMLEPSPAATEPSTAEDEGSGLYGGLPGAPQELFAVSDGADDLTAELPFHGPPSDAAAAEASELAGALGTVEPSLDLLQPGEVEPVTVEPEIEAAPEESAYAEPVQEEAAFDEPLAVEPFAALPVAVEPTPIPAPEIEASPEESAYAEPVQEEAAYDEQAPTFEPMAAVEPQAPSMRPSVILLDAGPSFGVAAEIAAPAESARAAEPPAEALPPVAAEPIAAEPIAAGPVAVEPTLADSDFTEPYFTETDFAAPPPVEPVAPAPPAEPIPAAPGEGELAFSIDDRPAPEARPAPVEAVEIVETEDEAARREAEGHARVAEATLDARDRALAWLASADALSRAGASPEEVRRSIERACDADADALEPWTALAAHLDEYGRPLEAARAHLAVSIRSEGARAATSSLTAARLFHLAGRHEDAARAFRVANAAQVHCVPPALILAEQALARGDLDSASENLVLIDEEALPEAVRATFRHALSLASGATHAEPPPEAPATDLPPEPVPSSEELAAAATPSWPAEPLPAAEPPPRAAPSDPVASILREQADLADGLDRATLLERLAGHYQRSGLAGEAADALMEALLTDPTRREGWQRLGELVELAPDRAARAAVLRARLLPPVETAAVPEAVALPEPEAPAVAVRPPAVAAELAADAWSAPPAADPWTAPRVAGEDEPLDLGLASAEDLARQFSEPAEDIVLEPTPAPLPLPPMDRATQILTLVREHAAAGNRRALASISEEAEALLGVEVLRPFATSLGRAALDAGRAEVAYRWLMLAREDDPEELTISRDLSRAAERTGRHAEEVAFGEPCADAIAPHDPLAAAARFHHLAHVLADKVGDLAGAAAIMEKALALAPDDRAGRRQLWSLWGRLAEARPRALDAWLEAARTDPSDVEALGQTADLAALLAGQAPPAQAARLDERARLATSLAAFVSHGRSVPASRLARGLPQEARDAMAAPGAAGPLGMLLGMLSPYLEPLFPADLQRRGASAGDRLVAPRAPVVRQALERAAALLDARAHVPFLVDRPGLELALENTRPPALVVPIGVEGLPEPVVEFLAVRALDLLGRGWPLVGKFAPRDVGILLELACRFAGATPPSMGLPAERATAFLEALARSVPPSLAERVRPLGPAAADELARLDVRAFTAALRSTGARVALLATGDANAALTGLQLLERVRPDRGTVAGPFQTVEQRELAELALSDPFLLLRVSVLA